MKIILLFTSLFMNFSCFANEETSLLDEKVEMETYLSSFPFEEYKIYDIPGQGKFYIDDINEPLKNCLRLKVSWEQHILDLIAQYAKEGSTVIDVGAHIGTHTIPLANKVGPSGRVFAFEPQKKLFRELVANAVLNDLQDRIALCHYAIGDTHKLVELPLGFCESGTGTVPVGSHGVLVEMRTIDSFDLKNVSLVKIDVEGGEDQVLDGMYKTIQENRPIILIEIQGGHWYETATSEIRNRIIFTQYKLHMLDYIVLHIKAHDYLAIPREFN